MSCVIGRLPAPTQPGTARLAIADILALHLHESDQSARSPHGAELNRTLANEC